MRAYGFDADPQGRAICAFARFWRSSTSTSPSRGVSSGSLACASGPGIDRAGLKRLLDRGAQLVEVLPAAEYAEELRPGLRVRIQWMDQLLAFGASACLSTEGISDAPP